MIIPTTANINPIAAVAIANAAAGRSSLENRVQRSEDEHENPDFAQRLAGEAAQRA